MTDIGTAAHDLSHNTPEGLGVDTGEDKPCKDEDCVDDNGDRSMAEVEMDGDLKYWVCPECGFEFDYIRVQQHSSDNCGIGVPESIRRAASANGAPRPEPGIVPLTLGKRPGL